MCITSSENCRSTRVPTDQLPVSTVWRVHVFSASLCNTLCSIRFYISFVFRLANVSSPLLVSVRLYLPPKLILLVLSRKAHCRLSVVSDNQTVYNILVVSSEHFVYGLNRKDHPGTILLCRMRYNYRLAAADQCTSCSQNHPLPVSYRVQNWHGYSVVPKLTRTG